MSDKIKFSELVKSFAEANDLTQQKAENLIRRVFNLLLEDLENEGKASITNFGSFELKEVAERNGVNPQTGEEIVIRAHNKVSFKPYKALESTVNAPFAHLESKLIEEETSKIEEPSRSEEVADTKTKEVEQKFDDPFESVIKPVEEKKSSETLEEVESPEEEQNEDEQIPPPIYKTEDRDKSSSGAMWLLIILLLILVGVGGWYFFLRDSTQENQMVENKPVATEQKVTPQSEPPRVTAKPVVNNEAKEPVATAKENASAPDMENTVPTTERKVPNGMTTYIIKKDEWMWDISRDVYGKAYLWPLIFEANKNVNNNPNLVEPAKTLIIPALNGNASALTKTDYANLASASKMVSDAYANAGNQERSAEYLRFSKKYKKRSN